MLSRIITGLLALVVAAAPLGAGAQSQSATITGRILDVSQGLAIPAASVQLEQGQKTIANATTDANGTFTFSDVAPAEYSLLVVARGYVSTRVPSLIVLGGQTTQLQTAMIRSESTTTTLKEIGRVVVASREALQATTTINQSVNPAAIQDYGYTRASDVLTTIPGVNTWHTSSSVGDDVNVSIRGFDASETATLLDGHPIGPIGAFGNGFNYKVSPFWGISNMNVIFGSGAAGLYGASTIAGAVNFETLNPTRTRHADFEQGIGNNGHSLSGFTATGELGKLGYAVAGAVQGTYGQFIPANRTQTANLAASQVYSDPTQPNLAIPDLTAANVAANTYNVTGDYLQKNALLKLDYQFSSKTQVLATATNWQTWNDKTGEGDNDYLPYGYVLNTAQGLAGQNFQLPNGSQTACSSSTIAVLNDSPANYACMTPAQYASAFSGPAGGGTGRWNASRLQDYHARVTQQIGKSQFIVDGFVDNFTSDEHKSPAGPFYFDTYTTHGVLLSDEFGFGKNNDVTLGWYTQHQLHNATKTFVPNGTFGLTSNSYFLRDNWTPNLKFSAFADLWYQYSYNTRQNNFDPRLSLVYRPTGRDVVRVTGGRAYSEPEPSLVAAFAPSLGAPLSINPVCAPGALNSVGTVPNTQLRTESAVDEEVAYGHRFNASTVVQLDFYNANEQNPILSGNVPLSAYGQGIPLLQAPDPNNPGNTLEQSFLQRIASQCGGNPTAAALGWTQTTNAGTARYQGFDLNGTIGIVRNLVLGVDYGTQSAQYQGVPIAIQQNNAQLINGGQFVQVPLHKGNVSLTYANASGLHASMEGVYVGANNWLNRGAFWYANAAISQTTGPVTVSAGVNNVFNSAASQWGYVGYGVMQPQNQFGTATNAFDQGTELFGLPFRQFFLTASIKV
ncbi:MAG TPA: TonB-dependent receptor [Candidatus Aquilonibacter sp.]|nr:TonB-dependent receptor [Candidatus Aquilonibacter sp.]